MEYKFYKEEIDKLVTLGVMPVEEEYNILFRFGNTGWTSEKAQDIINGVKDGEEKSKEEAYEWANEDIFLVSNENGIFLLDLILQRSGETDPEKLGLKLSHSDFLTFLEDFKTFIKENS